MNKEEKNIIIDLLLRKYKKTKDEKLLDLVKKVNKINWSFEYIRFDWCHMKAQGKIDRPFIDTNNPHFGYLNFSNTYLEFSNSGISVLSPEAFQRKLQEDKQC